MLTEFFLKRALKSHGFSDRLINALAKLINKNPSLFASIASEIKARTGRGEDQQTALIEVLKAHQDELADLIS
jgi:hypothetical protein